MNQEELKKRLIELMNQIESNYHDISEECSEDGYKSPPKYTEFYADQLIANGVTIRERGEWIPVKERLPEEDGKYLVARLEGSRYSISVRKFRKEVPCWYRGYCGHWERRTNGITHWAPLPEPPEAEKGGAE